MSSCKFFIRYSQIKCSKMDHALLLLCENFLNSEHCRCATGENWQRIMLDCSSGRPCDPESIRPNDTLRSIETGCGLDIAYIYFVVFFFLCSFLVSNFHSAKFGSIWQCIKVKGAQNLLCKIPVMLDSTSFSLACGWQPQTLAALHKKLCGN